MKNTKRTVAPLAEVIAASRQAPAAWKRAVEQTHWRDLKFPSDFRAPELRMPSDVQLPDIVLPKVHRGEVRRYDLQLPDVTIPRLHAGQVMAGSARKARRSQRRARRGGLGGVMRLAAMGLFAAAIVKEMSQPEEARTWQGRVLGVPYNFQPPTSKRFKDAWWSEAPTLFTPTPWGMGWTLNFRRLASLGRQMAVARMQHQGVPDERDARVGSAAESPSASASAAQQRQREDVVNQASIDSFPASDAPAY